MVLIQTSVGKNQDVGAVLECLVRLIEHTVDALFQAGGFIIGQRYGGHLEARQVQVLNL